MKKNIFIPVAFFMLFGLTVTPEVIFAKKWTVNVGNNSFVPSTLTHVKTGDTIMWVWVAGVHTTTSTSIPAGAVEWDSPITHEDSVFIYIPRVNGTFNYECTPHTGTMTGSFVVSGASGISSGIEMPQMTLYPNPFTEYITIRSANTACWVKSLKIYSTKGEFIRVMNYKREASSGTITVSLKDLASGAYIIRITDNSERSLIRRVIRY